LPFSYFTWVDALWPGGVRRLNANTAGLHRNYGPARQLIPVLCYYLKAHGALLSRGDVDQAHDARMRQAAPNCQFAKVLIERDEYTLLAVRLGQDVFIAWIVR